MARFKVLSFGDSVVWGQGLTKAQKFHEISARGIAEAIGAAPPDPQIIHYAHSGAVIEEPDLEPPFDGTLGAWQEVPHPTPTILDQVDFPGEQTGKPDPEVDLVIANGGINDVNFRTLLNPVGSLKDLERAIEENCYDDMKRLLRKIRDLCPNAVIIVVGYFPIISEESESEALKLTVGLLGPIGPLLTAGPLKIVLGKARYFYRRQLSWLRRAVTEFHADPAKRGPGVLFAHPAFGPRNSVGAPDALLFGPRVPDDLEDGWDFFLHNLVPGVVVFKPNDAMHQERRQACQHYLSDESDLERVQCFLASIGHPNPRGARRYAEVIKERYLSNRQISLRSLLSKLLTQSSDLSLRQAMARHCFTKPQNSLRDFQQHMLVDCIDVTIKTKDEPFAGTDDHVFLRVASGKQWRLFQEGIGNDFERGTTGTYTIDPAEGQPDRRLHLWDIKELSLVKKAATFSIASDWVPESIRVALNGRDVFNATIEKELTDHDPEWTAPNYPRKV